MRKKSILLYLLMILLLTGCTNAKLKRAEEKTNDYIEQITKLTEKINILTSENENLKNKLEKYEPEILEEGNCKFTKTYHVIDIMDNYEPEDDNSSKFVILVQYAIQQPFIVNLPNDKVVLLTEGEDYEFSFSGSKKYKKSENQEIFTNFELINVKKSDKVGLDQVQEECR